MNELINKDNEWIIHFMGSLDRLLDNVEHLTANYRPTLGGERFFTDKEVSARLKVSRRTLQDYRNEGRIAYIQLGGKILYRESDIFGKKRNGLRMKHQYSTSSVSRSPIFSDFPPVACFRCRMLFQACGKQRQGFRAEYAQTCLRKILPETALPPDLATAIQATRHLCIRHRGQVAGGMNFSYTIGCYPCHRKQTT